MQNCQNQKIETFFREFINIISSSNFIWCQFNTNYKKKHWVAANKVLPKLTIINWLHKVQKDIENVADANWGSNNTLL